MTLSRTISAPGLPKRYLTHLSNLKDLKVAGRTSSPHYNRENVGLREIGERLGVKTILKVASVKQGNRLRIMVQLVNVNDGFHLWSQKYDRSMDDIFAIQDEVALAVTEKLKVTLLEKDKARITKNHTKNTEAYELYLKGKILYKQAGWGNHDRDAFFPAWLSIWILILHSLTPGCGCRDLWPRSMGLHRQNKSR